MITALAATPMASLVNPDPADWDAVLAEAEGQTVYLNAWGGSTKANDFVAWIGGRVSEEYGVTLGQGRGAI